MFGNVFFLWMACLVIPGLWGALLYWLFNRFWPESWREKLAPTQEDDETPISELPPNVWDYQI